MLVPVFVVDKIARGAGVFTVSTDTPPTSDAIFIELSLRKIWIGDDLKVLTLVAL